jgi:hypothetical protein
LVFWVDLSTVGLIDGGFTTATFSAHPGSSEVVSLYLPQAKLGNGNYIYVFSGGWGDNGGSSSNGANYYGLSNVLQFGGGGGYLSSNVGLTVAQAYAIDGKIDDGMPLTGNTLAAFITGNNWTWPGVGWPNINIAPPTVAVTPAATSCFDNGGNSSNTMKYSVGYSNGNNVACGLTFKMQAGD